MSMAVSVGFNYGYIYSKSKNVAVGETGWHAGVLYNGNVYCNIHPEGLSKDSWINDFEIWTGNKQIVII